MDEPSIPIHPYQNLNLSFCPAFGEGFGLLLAMHLCRDDIWELLQPTQRVYLA
jgi:hypothetical protein